MFTPRHLSTDLYPLSGIGRRVTPPTSLFLCRQIFDQVSMDDLVEKQHLLTGYLELLVSLQLPEAEQITPADPAQRGCQLSFRFSNAHGIQAEMKRRGVEVRRGATCEV